MTNVLDLTKEPQTAEAPEPEAPEVSGDGADVPADLPDELAWDADAPYDAAGHRRKRRLMAAVAGAGILTAALQASWSTGLVVLAGVGAWALWDRHAGPSRVRVDRLGCTVDGHHLPHADLASFDLHRLNDNSVHLSLKTASRLARYIHLPLGDQDPEELHALLSAYVPEEQHPVPFWEAWLRRGSGRPARDNSGRTAHG